MRYLAIVEQDGGCDYTIGCGIKTFFIDADGTIQALEKLHGLVEVYIYNPDYCINTIQLFVLDSQISVPLVEWRREERERERLAKQQEQLDKELREYERLKQKFGNWT